MGDKFLDCCSRDTSVSLVKARSRQSAKSCGSNSGTFPVLFIDRQKNTRGNFSKDKRRDATRLRWTAFRNIIQPLLDNIAIEPRFFDYQLRKGLWDHNPSCALCG